MTAIFEDESENQFSPVAGAFFSQHLRAHLLGPPFVGRFTLYGFEGHLCLRGFWTGVGGPLTDLLYSRKPHFNSEVQRFAGKKANETHEGSA